MKKLKLLDLFCGAGGCAMGYHRAGFDVVGVDIKPQPNYPFDFIHADAMTYPLDGFDVIHASPPCQAFTSLTGSKEAQAKHPDLVGPVRQKLQNYGKPYVIENVVGSALRFPMQLCGTNFGLYDPVEKVYLRRHRLFECDPLILGPSSCSCYGKTTVYVSSSMQPEIARHKGHNKCGTKCAKRLMDIDWMETHGLGQAIPPAYTEYIGKQLMRIL